MVGREPSSLSIVVHRGLLVGRCFLVVVVVGCQSEGEQRRTNDNTQTHAHAHTHTSAHKLTTFARADFVTVFQTHIFHHYKDFYYYCYYYTSCSIKNDYQTLLYHLFGNFML